MTAGGEQKSMSATHNGIISRSRYLSHFMLAVSCRSTGMLKSKHVSFFKVFIPLFKIVNAQLSRCYVLFEFKVFVKKMGIIEMRAPHKFDGMVPALSHSAHLGDTHGNKNIGFNSFGIFSNPLCGEHTFIMGVIFWQHLEPLIWRQTVRYEINRYSAGIDIGYLVPTRNDADRESLLGKVLRQPGRHESIDCQRGWSDLVNRRNSGRILRTLPPPSSKLHCAP